MWYTCQESRTFGNNVLSMFVSFYLRIVNTRCRLAPQWAPLILLSLKKPQERTNHMAFGVLHFPLEWLQLMLASSTLLQWIPDCLTVSVSPSTPTSVLFFPLRQASFLLPPLQCSTSEPQKCYHEFEKKNQWQYFLRRSVEIKTFSMVCLGSRGNQLFIAQASSHRPPAALQQQLYHRQDCLLDKWSDSNTWHNVWHVSPATKG